MLSKTSSSAGHLRSLNQRLIISLCFSFWLIFVFLYWGSSVIPFKPADPVALATKPPGAPVEGHFTSASGPLHYQSSHGGAAGEEPEAYSIEPPEHEPPPPPPPPPTPQDLAANSTLGFESILALSAGPSWRTRGLAAAARLTGLDITTPPQPKNPDELVEAFRQMGAGVPTPGEVQVPQRGSAKAWMAHLDLLRYVIGAGLESALVIEDDVDWDVDIRAQMRLVSDAVRAYTGGAGAAAEGEGEGEGEGDPTHTAPYGEEWDVLWMGHCGALAMTLDGSPMPEPLMYSDHSRITNKKYNSWSKKYNGDRIPDGQRQVQESIITVCSFGYGVHRRSAPRVLELMARGAGEAFDVRLSEHCEAGPSAGGLRCLVVNPQLFNHYEPPPSEGYVSLVDIDDDLGGDEAAVVDEAQFEGKKGFTGGIATSARCRALFNETCSTPPPPHRAARGAGEQVAPTP